MFIYVCFKIKEKNQKKGITRNVGCNFRKKTCIYAESEQQKQIKTINKVNAILKKSIK